MSIRFRALLALSLLLAIPAIGRACLWDYDTLKQELARFPTTLELITGKFPRHSREFYAWRIRDRREKLKADPKNLEYHDDLAVAYQKTGEHEQAIATMLAKEKIKPGVYETYSNLGTFHILAGDFEKGLPYIEKALAIKPDAHFGREKYQKWLVEYAIARRKDGKLTFPMLPRQTWGKTFDFFIAEKMGREELSPEEVKAALQGVLGMMRFADHENPLLLEALGHLLMSIFDFDNDAKQLAARAYLKASYSMKDDPQAQQSYRKMAAGALAMQEFDGIERRAREEKVAKVEGEFAMELENAAQWYADLHAQELRWIREGKNADAHFDRFVAKLEGTDRPSYAGMAAIAAAIAIAILTTALLLRSWRGNSLTASELPHASR